LSNEDQLIRDASRAVRARQLLDDEMLTDAFKTLEDAYMSGWRRTTIDDVAGREKLFLAVNIVAKIRDHLAAAVTNGKLAQAELNEIANAAQRKKRFGII
jgi:hypothetical protein